MLKVENEAIKLLKRQNRDHCLYSVVTHDLTSRAQTCVSAQLNLLRLKGLIHARLP
mgnify:CR=1 FL=1